MDPSSLDLEPPYDVVIAGAGPAGLVAAIDLGRRGVRCVVLEKRPGPAPWPKADRANARTMELLRRLGLAEKIRAVGYPADNPMDVFVIRRLNEPAVARLPYPSVQSWRAEIAESRSGSEPLEPYQLVSQNAIEPVLMAAAMDTPGVTLRYGWEVTSIRQDADSVHVEAATPSGRCSVTGRYLVAADGGRSTVRRALGLELQGWSGDQELVQVIFDSDQLYANILAGPGRHYMFLDGSMLVAQGSRKEFTLHTTLPPDSDFSSILRRLIGSDVGFEIRHVLTWRHRLAITDSYTVGRIHLVGDAAHLVIPSGGLGMNTAIGDALNISWKLAAVVRGWGGPALLESYESERRPVGVRNVEASGWAAGGIGEWRAVVDSGTASDAEIAASAQVLLNRMHTMLGAELGYGYYKSPVVDLEPDPPDSWDITSYAPSARPGARLPHRWLRDGRASQDAAGEDYTLLELGGGPAAPQVADAFRDLGAPLTTVVLDQPALRDTYGASSVLLRPDLHVAWRGDADPDDPKALASLVTGWQG